jgi:large subunit ribosomal protein L25
MDVTLTAETGRPTGSRVSGRLRREGKVPGVVYGLGSDPVAVTVEWPSLRKVLTTDAGLNALINLTVDGNTNLSVVKELQRDPVRRTVTHVDFMLIDRDAPLSVEVPIILEGEAPKLEAMKGMIDQLLFTLTILAKPGQIPTQIEVDVTSLELGSQIKVSDITLPANVTTELDPEAPVAQGSPTRSTIILQQQAAKEASGMSAEEAREEALAEAEAADEAEVQEVAAQN